MAQCLSCDSLFLLFECFLVLSAYYSRMHSRCLYASFSFHVTLYTHTCCLLVRLAEMLSLAFPELAHADSVYTLAEPTSTINQYLHYSKTLWLDNTSMFSFESALSLSILTTATLALLVFLQPAIVDYIFRNPTVALFKVCACVHRMEEGGYASDAISSQAKFQRKQLW
jgi:hypothetical protein